MNKFIVTLSADVGETVCTDSEFIEAKNYKAAHAKALALGSDPAYWSKIGYLPGKNVRVIECAPYGDDTAFGSVAWCETQGDNR